MWNISNTCTKSTCVAFSLRIKRQFGYKRAALLHIVPKIARIVANSSRGTAVCIPTGWSGTAAPATHIGKNS